MAPYTWRSSVSNLGDRSLASSRAAPLRWSSTLAASTPEMFTRRLAGMDLPLPSLGGALLECPAICPCGLGGRAMPWLS